MNPKHEQMIRELVAELDDAEIAEALHDECTRKAHEAYYMACGRASVGDGGYAEFKRRERFWRNVVRQ